MLTKGNKSELSQKHCHIPSSPLKIKKDLAAPISAKPPQGKQSVPTTKGVSVEKFDKQSSPRRISGEKLTPEVDNIDVNFQQIHTQLEVYI